MPALDVATKAVWKEADAPVQYASLTQNITVDVAVIGAGITGLTTALLLQKSGRRVAVIEADKVGGGASGFNSGHLTTLLLDMKYSTVFKNFGEEQTREVAKSQQYALDLIAQMIRDFNIDCDYQTVPGYLFAENESQEKTLKTETEAAQKAGIDCQGTESVPLPFNVLKGTKFPNQARFQPMQYLHGLAKAFIDSGGQIFESTAVTSIDGPQKPDEEKLCTLKTEHETEVTATDVVQATHTAQGFMGALTGLIEPMRSYVIAARVKNPPQDALYWDAEDIYHYIRVVSDEKGPLVIMGGEDHRVGDKKDTTLCFSALEDYARTHFEVLDIDYRWSAELYNPADGLPYIGLFKPHFYIASGFSGEGLTGGSYAAKIIADGIQGFDNPWAEIYDPKRVKPLASAAGFIAEGAKTGFHTVESKLKPVDTQNPDDIQVGEGKLIELNGKKTAAFRDESGKLHLLSPTCTHMGCTVGWNPAEKSWDCPCHGGRFDATGNVIDGPPHKNLEPVS